MNSLTCMSEWIYDILTSTASWVSLVSLVMSSCFMHSLVLFPDYRKRIWERDYSWLPFLNIAHFRVHAVQPWVLAVRFCIFSSLSEVMQSPGHSPRKQGTLWKWTNYLSGELIPESGGNKDCLHSNVLVYSNCVSVCVSNSFLGLDFLSVSVVSQPPAFSFSSFPLPFNSSPSPLPPPSSPLPHRMAATLVHFGLWHPLLLPGSKWGEPGLPRVPEGGVMWHHRWATTRAGSPSSLLWQL